MQTFGALCFMCSLMAASAQVNFIVLGDWGMGNTQQLQVARAMETYGKVANASFVINVGDNFYKEQDATGNYQGGVTNLSDPLWKSYYENVYQGHLATIPFYSVLGNHDYLGNVSAQLLYGTTTNNTRWYMPSRNYSVQFPVNDKVNATIIFIDTTSLIQSYYTTPDNQNMADNLRTQNATQQLQWLEETLNNTKSGWKFVVGHHPILTASSINVTQDMAVIQPLLAKYGVQAYISGHVHSLEQLQDVNYVDYFISGAGAYGKIYPENEGMLSMVQFQSTEAGFMAVTMTGDTMKISFMGIYGKVLYQYTTKRVKA